MILKNGKRLDGCSDTVPVGTLNPFLGSVAPYGYLICAGQLVSKTTYKELYEICGDSFGEGTTTEFRLPDLRGKTITGYKEGDTTFGTLGGLIGELTHAHEYGITYQANAGVILGDNSLGVDIIGVYNNGVKKSAIISDKTSTKTLPFASDSRSSTTYTYSAKANTTESSNLQPSINMNWIVKAFLLMPNQSYVENSLDSESTINSLSAAKGKELHTRLSSIENRLVVNSGNLVITPSVDVTKDYSTVSSSYLSYQASIAHPWIDYNCYTSEPRYFRLRVGYKQNSNYESPWRDIAIGRNGGDTWSYRIGFSSKDVTVNGDYSVYERYFTVNSSQTLNNVIVFLWEHVTCGCTIKYIELCEMKYIS